MQSTDPVLSLRLRPEDSQLLDTIALEQQFTRSDCARLAITYGLPMVRAGHSFNITRIILLMEYLQAAIDIIITSQHGDMVPQLLEDAKKRLEIYHGKA